MKLIVLSGAKHSKKDLVASRLAENSDCIWIRPYSDKKIPINRDADDYDFISLNQKQLNEKMAREVPLVETIVGGNRYVFFETQLLADYVVLIGDDRVVFNLKNNWDGDLVTVKCHSKGEVSSSRSLMDDKEFDIVFNYESDDFDSLVAEIEDIYNYEVK